MECSKGMALAGEGMNLAGVTADLGAQLLGGTRQWAPHVDRGPFWFPKGSIGMVEGWASSRPTG